MNCQDILVLVIKYIYWRYQLYKQVSGSRGIILDLIVIFSATFSILNFSIPPMGLNLKLTTVDNFFVIDITLLFVLCYSSEVSLLKICETFTALNILKIEICISFFLVEYYYLFEVKNLNLKINLTNVGKCGSSVEVYMTMGKSEQKSFSIAPIPVEHLHEAWCKYHLPCSGHQ